MTRRTGLIGILFLSALIFLGAGSLLAADFPKPVGYVNDFAGVIGSSEEARIEAVAQSVNRATGADIVVATVDSLGNYGSIEQYSIALGTE